MKSTLELVRNHASDLITQDLIFGGFYKYGDMSQYGVSFKYPYAKYEHATGNIFWSREHMEELRALDMSDETAARLLHDLEVGLDAYRTFVDGFIALHPKSRSDVVSAVERWFEVTQRAIPMVSYFVFEESFSKRLVREGFSLIDIPSSRTDVTDVSEKIAVLRKRFAQEFVGGSAVSSELLYELEQIASRYGYLGMKYFSGSPWTSYDIYQMALHNSSVQPDSLLQVRAETPTVHTLSELMRMRTLKWELMCRSVTALRSLIEKHLTNYITFDDLLWCTVEEGCRLVRGELHIVPHRNTNFTVKVDETGYAVTFSDDAVRSEAMTLSTEQEISGMVAHRGKVQGIARVVRTPREASKVMSGDILVATMSTPDFLPAMQRAAAFVTDIGGITSHAAIVSRELKKPCIIGTKIATQVLHDGDLVEVDADNGVVRLVRRSGDEGEVLDKHNK